MKRNEQMVHYVIKVSGRVQGVFYRASTKETADKLGIKGWVRNEPDGSVLIEAEGTRQQVEKLIAWCHQGPQLAYVEQVEQEEKPLEGFQEFSVLR